MDLKLVVAYPNTSSGGDAISVSPVGIFTMFENVDVSATNPGYIKIGNEIISYSGISGNLNKYYKRYRQYHS